MARYGILIDYDYCTGCHTCEVACQQEHDYPVGTNGVVEEVRLLSASAMPLQPAAVIPTPAPLKSLMKSRRLIISFLLSGPVGQNNRRSA